MGTLVPTGETPLLLALLVACAAGALWAEQRWGFVRRITAFIVALLAGMLLSNARVIPSSAPAIDIVWTWVVPLALPLLLPRANLVRIFRETGPTLGAFLIGAVGSAVGGLLAAWLVPLGPEAWKASAVFVATYTGGSINFLAVALGAAADVGTIVRQGPLLFVMAALAITVHMVFLFGVCRMLRLPLPETIIASNANIGGPTTASAFAVAVHWERPVLPGVLTGVLGYVIANYVALAVGWAVR